MKRRIGAVGYLNSRPLVEGLDLPGAPFETRFDVPSRCAALLHAGEIDLGIVPSIEFTRRPEYRIVPGIAVACDGPVASVAVFSKVPIERVRSLALDTSSRTSATLVQVLCAERFGISPRFEPAAPGLEAMLADHDAALLIGDPALFADEARLGVLKVDLGDEWKAHTGLPFVWAVWVGREDAADASVCAALAAARDAGVAAIPRIAADYSKGDSAITRRVEEYLRRNVHYELGEAHQLALARFYASAMRLGLVSAAPAPRFFACSPQVVKG